MIDRIEYIIKYKPDPKRPYNEITAYNNAYAESISMDIYTENGQVIKGAIINFYRDTDPNIPFKSDVLNEDELEIVDGFLYNLVPEIAWYGGRQFLRGITEETDGIYIIKKDRNRMFLFRLNNSYR